MGRPYHHGNLRTELLRLGELEIARSGLAHFGLREVSRKAGVSSAAAFRHFASKDDLVLAIAAEGFRALLEALRKGDNLNAEAKLRFGFGAYLEFAVARPGCVRAMFGGVLERCDPQHEALALSNEAFAWLAAAVQEGASAGLVQDGSAHTALVFFSALHGAAVLHLEMGTFPTIGPLEPSLLAQVLFETLVPGRSR